jgi:hypothetical protein
MANLLHAESPMKKKVRLGAVGSYGLLLVEVAVYALLVTGYLLLALRWFRPFLLDAFEHRRILYACLAVLLMLGQGFLLELLTTLLMGLFARTRRREGRATPGVS